MQNTRIRFFGPPIIERHGILIPKLATRKSLGLLAYLAVRSKPVGREELAALLWQDLSSDRSRSNLRYVLHQISTLLPGCLEIRRHTIQFVTPPRCWIDLFALQDCLALNTTEALEEGLALYRGEFMEGLYIDDAPEFEAWLVIERERWRQKISGAFAALVKQQRKHGNADAVLRSVERWLTLERWQEAAHCAKMEILAQQGQHEAALAQYELCRKILETELGVEPGPEIQALKARIERAELNPMPESTAGGAAPRRIFKLGPALTSILGRDREIAEIKGLLRSVECRWLTITGAPGVGKTRLAHQVAQELAPEYADGVLLVDLAPLSDPELVLLSVSHRLGIPENGGDPLMTRVQSYLQGKSLLLFLDNLEQVAPAALQLQQLLSAPETENVRLLVTSRSALRVRGEFEYLLNPLELPAIRDTADLAALTHNPAVALLAKRIQSVKPRFAPGTENARALADICIRLDGLPLALELAAAKIRSLPLQTIRERLARWEDVAALEMLTGGARDVPARQQTLRQAIAWSYELLSAAEKKLFAELGVFSGGWTPEFAEQLSRGDDLRAQDWRDALDGLVNHSLVKAPDPNAPEPRWSMLEILHEYALERLEATGETEKVRARHAAVMLEWVQKESAVRRTETGRWLNLFEQEHDNLRAALKWACSNPAAHDLFLELVHALESFWYIRGYLREASEWVERALAWNGHASVARAQLLMTKGTFAYRQGGLEAARQALAESAALYTRFANDEGKRQALFYLGMVELSAGNLEPARASLEASLALHRQGESPDGMARYGMGIYFLQTGDVERARQWLEESLTQLRARSEIMVLAYPLLALARVAYREQAYARARAYLEEAVSVLQETGDKIELAQTLCRLGHVARLEKDWKGALARYRSSWELAFQYGAYFTQPQILEGRAGVAVEQDEPEKAAVLLGAATAVRQAHAIPIPPADRLDYQGIVARVRAQLPAGEFELLEQQGTRKKFAEIAVLL